MAALRDYYVPSLLNWPRMIKHWLAEHLKTSATPCWLCEATIDNSTVATTRIWCELCAVKALELLPKVSYMDCDMWECKNAATYVDEIREKMVKAPEEGQK